MKFELIKKIDSLEMYGDIPCLPVIIKSDEGERFVGEESDSWILLDDFVTSFDSVCSNQLDYGDVDYFDVYKCYILKEWLEQRKKEPMTDRLKELYTQLELYVIKAIEIGTGVVIGL